MILNLTNKVSSSKDVFDNNDNCLCTMSGNNVKFEVNMNKRLNEIDERFNTI